MLKQITPVLRSISFCLKDVLEAIKSTYCIVYYLKYYKFVALLSIVYVCGTYGFEVQLVKCYSPINA